MTIKDFTYGESELENNTLDETKQMNNHLVSKLGSYVPRDHPAMHRTQAH